MVISAISYGITKPPRMINRKLLKPVINNNLKVLEGPKEKSEAQKYVAACSAGNAVIAAATAQLPGIDQVALTGVEIMMARHIFNDIYKLGLSNANIAALGAAVVGNKVGPVACSKLLTWIPGFGNAINAAVAGATTGSIGALLIHRAEAMEKALLKAKQNDDKFVNHEERITNIEEVLLQAIKEKKL